MKRILIVVDMQNDFLTGPLGNAETAKIIPAVENRIKQAILKDDSAIIFTRDTHYESYFDTLEGIKLPVKHCIYKSDGWEICPELEALRNGENIFTIDKKTFGADWIGRNLLTDYTGYTFDDVIKTVAGFGRVENVIIEICGVCTDICVVSNALILRALYPNNTIVVDSHLCAGVTVAKHEAALETMRSCQIDVL